jgi:hypothetical protein
LGISVLLASLFAADPAPITVITPANQPIALKPVAWVNNRAITLGELERTLIAKEGADLITDQVRKDLEERNWDAVADDQRVLPWNPTRAELLIALLSAKGGAVREELINLALVEQAIAADGRTLDRSMVDNELKRMQQRLDAGMEKRGNQRMDLRAFIQSTYDMSLERWTQQRGFRLLVGLHVLVEGRAKTFITDADVAAWLERHRDRYRVPEAVDVSSIFLPWPTPEAGSDPAQDRANLMAMAVNLHDTIRAGRLTFAKAWAGLAGRQRDPDAGADGRLGWVRRDGTGEIGPGRTVIPAAVAKAFVVQPPWPALLDPVAGERGVELLLVHGRRAAADPTAEELADRIRRDIVDAELESRTQQMLKDLRRASSIRYESLADLIEQRRGR